MRNPEGVLMVQAIAVRPDGEGSLLEVMLFDPWRGGRSDIKAEYDLASLGEVDSIHGPSCYPPRWMVSYKEKVSAKRGDRIQSERAKADSRVSAIT